MQRKFKLIKTYPGSSTLNTIVKEVYFGNPNGYYISNIEQESKMTFCRSDVENNPEFWQEITEIPVGTKAYNSLIQSTIIRKEDGWYKIPADSDLKTSYTDEDILKQKSFQIVEEVKKDYEILSFIDISRLIKREDGLFYRENTQNEGVKETQIAHFRINSVKRLSDGEVFQIGDNISNSFISEEEIEKIIICNNPRTDVVACFNDAESIGNIFFCVANNHGNVTLKQAKKLKPILFTTEDGVDIFEGDAFWFVAKDFTGKEPGKLIAEKNIVAQYSQARFSTKEKAQEYIILNKPCLSINDVKGFLIEGDLKELKELVKSKL
jgi:hypothetical protein